MKIQKDKFKEYLIKAYSNKSTRHQYFMAERRFLRVTRTDYLDQDSVDKYILEIRKNKPNFFYMAFLKAYLNCYDPDNTLNIKIVKDKSKRPSKPKKPKHLTHEQIQYLIKKTSRQVSLLIRIYYETGLRVSELFNVQKKNIDLKTRHLKGVGKGNKPFSVHFSKKTAYLISLWLDYRKDNYPFRIVNKSTGEYYRQQRTSFWYHFKKQTRIVLGIDAHPHLIRHALGYNLRANQKWDLEQIRTKLRHENLATTQIYSSATIEEIERKEDNELFESP